MLSWVLIALAAAIVVAVALQQWKQSRRLRRVRRPAAPRLPVILAHGFLGFDEIALGNRKHLYFRGIGAHLEQAGAQLYSLHKNRWWQTRNGPLLDAGVFVAGLEYAADTDAVVLGKPSTPYFESALKALDADPSLTWMVGDDIEADIGGAAAHGMKTVLVRTGKFRPDVVEASRTRPDGIISSIAQLPDWLEEHL